MRHIKKFAALLLAAICTMMVLTGCVDKASLYDDTQQIAAGRTAYSATGYQGGYVMGDGSFDFTASADKLVGAVEAFDIDVKNESTLVDCYTTVDTTNGEFKILFITLTTNRLLLSILMTHTVTWFFLLATTRYILWAKTMQRSTLVLVFTVSVRM